MKKNLLFFVLLAVLAACSKTEKYDISGMQAGVDEKTFVQQASKAGLHRSSIQPLGGISYEGNLYGRRVMVVAQEVGTNITGVTAGTECKTREEAGRVFNEWRKICKERHDGEVTEEPGSMTMHSGDSWLMLSTEESGGTFSVSLSIR